MCLNSHMFSIYSVTQSYANSFLGDVVLDSFNNLSRDEDNILEKIYKSKYLQIFIMIILDFYIIIQKYILTLNYH